MSSGKHTSHILWLLAASLVALQWIVLRLSGVHLPHLWGAVLSGVGILNAHDPECNRGRGDRIR